VIFSIYRTSLKGVILLDFYIYLLSLIVKKEKLEFFINQLFDQYFKKNRLLHVTGDNNEFISLKITADVVTFRFFFPDKFGNLQKFILNGTYDKLSDEIHLHTASPDNFSEINNEEYKAITHHFIELSKIAVGEVLFSTGYIPKRIKDGKLDNPKVLLDEIESHLSSEDKEKLKHIFHLFRESF
jgi:hypothetical protein